MSGASASSKICNTFWYCISPLKIIFDSLKIILRNKRIFISIFISLSLPLSLLILYLSLSTHPLLSEIYHLEAVALLAPTRFEARHVWQESRSDAIHLLKIKALFSLPTFFLSLTTAITAVHATVQSHNNKTLTLTLRSAIAAVKQNWKQPSITAILIYAILIAVAPIQRIFLVTTSTSELRFLGFVIGSCFEVYLMAVLGLGLVVSISEERFGWEAIKVGWGLMAGRRLCGMVLTGFFVVVSGEIRRRMEEVVVVVVGGRVSSGEGKMGILCVYAVVVVWSYVVMTVFYCDCRRWHGIKEVEDDDNEGTGISNSML